MLFVSDADLFHAALKLLFAADLVWLAVAMWRMS